MVDVELQVEVLDWREGGGEESGDEVVDEG